MKLIVFFILVAFGIVAWALLNPDQDENILAVKEAIGIDDNNPYAAKMRNLSRQQQSITEALDSSSSSLNGAMLPDKLIATQREINEEFKAILKGLEKEWGEEEIVLDIEDSEILGELMGLPRKIKDGRYSKAAEISKRCARQMSTWANKLDGSD